MKRSCLLACCTLLGLGLAACGFGDSMPDPGPRTEEVQNVDLDGLLITVRGQAQVPPEAARLLADRGKRFHRSAASHCSSKSRCA